jgi:excisionase family DNA binding protein
MKEAASRSVLTTWEAGRYCSVSPYTVRHWIAEGLLPAYTTPGGHHRIRREDLDVFLARYKMPSSPELVPGKRRILLVGLGHESRKFLALCKRISPRLEARAPRALFDAGLLVHAFSPHLVLFDMDAKGFDWKAACRQIRGDSRLSSVRLAGVTKRVTVEMVEAAQKAGMVEVLGKPIELSALRALLKEVFPYLRANASRER